MYPYRFAEFIAIALEVLAVFSVIGTALGLGLALLLQSWMLLVSVLVSGLCATVLLFGLSQTLHLLLELLDKQQI